MIENEIFNNRRRTKSYICNMLKLKELYNKIPEILKNKFVVTGFLFLIWISFLDENNLVLLNDRLNELNEKEKTIDSLLLEISEMEDRLERLNNNQEELVRFARENFLMKKEGEDIILIREKTDE